MPKMKTHSGAKKRFKTTPKGKVVGRHAMTSHILGKKSAKRKRRLGKPLPEPSGGLFAALAGSAVRPWWNFPVEIILNKLGPILAMGNTCVLKPAPDTPWNATRIGRLIADALPKSAPTSVCRCQMSSNLEVTLP